MFQRKQTVDGIMAGFQQTIDKLETLQVNANADIDMLSAQKVEIDQQIAIAESESSRAKIIADSLTNLIRPTSQVES